MQWPSPLTSTLDNERVVREEIGSPTLDWPWR